MVCNLVFYCLYCTTVLQYTIVYVCSTMWGNELLDGGVYSLRAFLVTFFRHLKTPLPTMAGETCKRNTADF